MEKRYRILALAAAMAAAMTAAMTAAMMGAASLSIRAKAAADVPTLVVATYDSFVGKHGLGAAIFPMFEKKCGCKVKVLALGDGAQLLSELQLDRERDRHNVQVVLGLDQETWARAKPFLEEWGSWSPRGYSRIVRAARGESGFLPFDYGVLAFVADLEALKAAHLQPPGHLSDLLKPEWRRNVILEDPRTSTPGMQFLLYADAVGGEGFWGKFKTQWLTLAPGWDGAYGLFLKKQAPLVWSYTTSQAYHEEHGEIGKYRALVFEDGNPVQVEGAAIVKGAFETAVANSGGAVVEAAKRARLAALRKLAREFLEFLISPEVQAQVPLKNWMLPVMPGVALPASFKRLPEPLKIVSIPTSAQASEKALVHWRHEIHAGSVP